MGFTTLDSGQIWSRPHCSPEPWELWCFYREIIPFYGFISEEWITIICPDLTVFCPNSFQLDRKKWIPTFGWKFGGLPLCGVDLYICIHIETSPCIPRIVGISGILLVPSAWFLSVDVYFCELTSRLLAQSLVFWKGFPMFPMNPMTWFMNQPHRSLQYGEERFI